MTVFGIDLGTSTSAVGYADARGVHMIPALPAGGSALTPSEVCLLDAPGAQAIVGAQARDAFRDAGDPNSARYFEQFKRDIGGELPRRYHAPFLGVRWDPVALSALVLRKLKRDVQRVGSSLNTAVITFPQHFYQDAKLLTREAASIAGIDAVLQVSEPFAAAMAQGFGENDTRGKVMIFDLGGGTLDVNVLEVEPGAMRVIGQAGDPRLGGADFDERVLGIIDKHMLRHFGRGWADATPAEQVAWRKEARSVKESLQAQLRPVDVKATLDDVAAPFSLTRSYFAEECKPLLSRIENTAQRALEMAQISWDELEQVVMVGGSSRLVAVQDIIRARAGARAYVPDLPELQVVMGAAFLGHRHTTHGSTKLDLEQTSLGAGASNLLPRATGLRVWSHERGRDVAHILVAEDTRLPTEYRQPFWTTGQARTIEVDVVEVDPWLPDEPRPIGRCIIDGLPSGLPEGSKVELCLKLDLGGGLSVEVSGAALGEHARARIELGASSSGGATGRELARTIAIRAGDS